ncbi:MAG: hypothetical protein WC341_15340 [Bacteroidales bacterium]|jgi:hypothetical protein
MATRIPLSECKHGGLYRIFSRNLSFGVFNQHNSGFIGIREKFGNYYLFTEFHYDTGAPFGTVSPTEYLEDYPGEISERIEVVATEEIMKRYIGASFKVGDTTYIENEALFKWLEEKQKQHAKEDE